MLIYFVITLIAVVIFVSLFRPQYNARYHNLYQPYLPMRPPRFEQRGEQPILGFIALIMLVLFLGYIFFENKLAQNKDGPLVFGKINLYSTKPDSTLAERDAPDVEYENKNMFDPPIEEESDEWNQETLDEYDVQENFSKTDTEIAYGTGTLYLQTGSFNQLGGARIELKRIRQVADGRARIQVIQSGSLTSFNVLIGPFETREEVGLYKNQYPLSGGEFIKDLATQPPQFLN